MKKFILGGLAAAAVAAPIAAVASPGVRGPADHHHAQHHAERGRRGRDRPACAQQPVHQDADHRRRHGELGREDRLLDVVRERRYDHRRAHDQRRLEQRRRRRTARCCSRARRSARSSTASTAVTWQQVTGRARSPRRGGTHHVQVAYNDRPGSYDDNFGSLSLNVVRTKG